MQRFVLSGWTLLTVLMATGCAVLTAIEGEVPDTRTPAQILITSEGGIASLRVRLRLDSLGRTVTRETCSLGVPAAECGSRGNREVSAVAPAEVSSAFAATQSTEFRGLRADYGTSTQGADLMTHSVSVTANGRTRAIRGDDITMPQLARDVHVMLNGLVRR